MRTCTRCGGSKESSSFAWKSQAKGKRHSHCKDCQKGISTKHYNANRDEYIDRAKNHYKDQRAENEILLKFYLDGKSCHRCKEADSQVLAFIPVDGVRKKSTVRRLLSQSWERVQAEIDRSLLLCANCRKKTKPR